MILSDSQNLLIKGQFMQLQTTDGRLRGVDMNFLGVLDFEIVKATFLESLDLLSSLHEELMNQQYFWVYLPYYKPAPKSI